MHSIQHYLRTYRSEIKGVAILWVVFFHAQLGLDGFWYDVQKIGYGGVDLFFFLTGFGLYHSLEKSPDLRGYVKRRALRLLPSYLPFCLVWLAVMLPMYGGGMAASARIIAGNLTMLGYFANVPLMINWYVSALVLFMMLAPLIHACLKTDGHHWIRTLLLLGLAFAAGLAFIGNDQYMVFSRLPVLILGMAFARPCDEKKNGGKWAFAFAISFALGMAVLYLCHGRFPELLNDYAMYWHPFVLIAPAMCAGLGWLFGHMPHAASAPLRVLGRASFEIFLFNVWIEVLGKKFRLFQTAEEWILWSVGSIAAGLVYHLLAEVLTAALRKRS